MEYYLTTGIYIVTHSFYVCTYAAHSSKSPSLGSFSDSQPFQNAGEQIYGYSNLGRHSSVVVPKLFENLETPIHVLLTQGRGGAHCLTPRRSIVNPVEVDPGEVFVVTPDVL